MKKNLSNQDIVNLLREISAVLEIQKKDPFRVRAYLIAADSIEKEGASLYTLWKNNQLEDIPNIGEKIAMHLDELFRTGTPKYLNNIKKKVPSGVFPLLKIEGIGPQFAYKIAKNLALNSEKSALKKTLKAAKMGKIAKISGMGEKIQARLIEILSAQLQSEKTVETQRIRIDIAETISNEVLSYLQTRVKIVNASALGSL